MGSKREANFEVDFNGIVSISKPYVVVKKSLLIYVFLHLTFNVIFDVGARCIGTFSNFCSKLKYWELLEV